MKNCKVLLCVIIILFSQYASSQTDAINFNIGNSIPIKFTPKDFYNSDIVGDPFKIFYDPNGCLLIARTEGSYIGNSLSNEIVKIQKDSTTEKAVQISFHVLNFKTSVFGFVELNNKFFALAITDESSTFINVYANEVDKSTLSIVGNPVKIFSYNYTVPSTLKGMNGIKEVPRCVSSPDGKKLLVYFFEANNSTEKNNIHMKVFEGNFDSNWERNVALPEGTDKIVLRDVNLNNDGTVIILALKDSRNKMGFDKPKDIKESPFHLLSITSAQEKAIDRKVEIDNRIIDLRVDKIENGNIVVAGFYSTDYDEVSQGYVDTKDKIQGVFYCSYPSDQVLPTVKSSFPIPISVINDEKNNPALTIYDKKDCLKNYQLNKLVIDKQGGVKLISEYHVDITSVNTSFEPENDDTRYYNDILIFNIGETGNLLWTKRVPKTQLWGDDDFFDLSYSLLSIGEKILLFYLENPDNPVEEPSSNKKVYKSKGSFRLVCMEVDKDGSLHKNAIMEANISSKKRPPFDLIQISSNSFIFMSEQNAYLLSNRN